MRPEPGAGLQLSWVLKAPGGADGLTAGRCNLAQLACSAGFPVGVEPTASPFGS